MFVKVVVSEGGLGVRVVEIRVCIFCYTFIPCVGSFTSAGISHQIEGINGLVFPPKDTGIAW